MEDREQLEHEAMQIVIKRLMDKLLCGENVDINEAFMEETIKTAKEHRNLQGWKKVIGG